MSEGLRLKAESAEDVAVISAALQDAALKIGDVRYDAKARRFSMEVNRFQWEKAGKRGPYYRSRAVIDFESVLSVQSTKVQRDDGRAVAVVLSVTFTPDAEPPGGVVHITLAGGGEIKLIAECIDAVLIDTGPVWPTPHKPFHGSR